MDIVNLSLSHSLNSSLFNSLSLILADSDNRLPYCTIMTPACMPPTIMWDRQNRIRIRRQSCFVVCLTCTASVLKMSILKCFFCDKSLLSHMGVWPEAIQGFNLFNSGQPPAFQIREPVSFTVIYIFVYMFDCWFGDHDLNMIWELIRKYHFPSLIHRTIAQLRAA